MRKLFAIVLVGLLAGCTAGNADPAPMVTTGSSSTTASIPTTPVDIPAGACITPSDIVLSWVRSYSLDSEYPASSIAEVNIGHGNIPGETWDIVAFSALSTATGAPLAWSYLTNANSITQPSGLLWISIGTNFRSNWANVSWSGERLSAGQDAQRTAFACLGFD